MKYIFISLQSQGLVPGFPFVDFPSISGYIDAEIFMTEKKKEN